MEEQKKDIWIQALRNLEEGREPYLPTVYVSILLGGRSIRKRAGIAISACLKHYTIQRMIRLCERFRESTSLEWMWDADWKTFSLEAVKSDFASAEDYGYALILGSFHPNGYFRERCVWEMKDIEKMLPYLILRMNDWVDVIQRAAYQAACQRVETCPVAELVQSTASLQKVKRSERRDREEIQWLEERLLMRLKEHIKNIRTEEITQQEFYVRKNTYQLLVSNSSLDLNLVNEFLEKEKHDFCKAILIMGILNQGLCPAEQLDGYLNDKNFVVRRKVLAYLYGIRKNAWPGLEKLLLDNSLGVRELAAFILRRHSNMDILQYYKDHINQENPEPVLKGIGENGGIEDAALVMPFLHHTSKKVVRCALQAAGKLLGEAGSDLYWEYFKSPDVTIVKTASQVILSYKIRYGTSKLYQEYFSCFPSAGQKAAVSASGIPKALPPIPQSDAGNSPDEVPPVKRYLIKMLVQEESWERLPFLARIYRDPSLGDKLRFWIYAAMASRNPYGKITEQQKAAILQVLEEEKNFLPEGLVRGIKFELPYVTCKNP